MLKLLQRNHPVEVLKSPEVVISPEIPKRNHPKIQTKLSYLEFEDWYLTHPWAKVPEMADRFQVSLRTVYNKLKRFNKKYEKKVDSKLSSMTLIAYKEGYRQGMVSDASSRELSAYKEGYSEGVLIGAGLGGLTADLLKTHGIGISDLVAWIAKSVKGNDGKTQTQSPTETNSQTASR